MDTHPKRWSVERLVVIGALAVGVAAGSYGIANAASGSGASAPLGASSITASDIGLQAASAPSPSAQHPWGGQRSDETLLTGSTAQKVTQLALAKLPGATIVRVETDADGKAAYEAHVVQSDGTPATVYVDKSFAVVKVEESMPAPPAGIGSGA